MESKPVRRIPSIFSLASFSSERGRPASQSTSDIAGLARKRSPSKAQSLPASDIPILTPPPDAIPPRNALSPVTSPQHEHKGPSSDRENDVHLHPSQAAKHLSESSQIPIDQVSKNSTDNRSEAGSRSVSRANSPSGQLSPTNLGEFKGSRRKSWFIGKSRGESRHARARAQMPRAWLLSPNENIDYDLSALLNFQPVRELWEATGDTLVFLHSGDNGKGPSFKLSSASFASSRKLSSAAHGRSYPGRIPSQGRSPGRPRSLSRVRSPSGQVRTASGSSEFWLDVRSQQLSPVSINSPPLLPKSPISPKSPKSPKLPREGSSESESYEGYQHLGEPDEAGPGEIHLHIPAALQADLTDPQSTLTSADVESLVILRNFVAFLTGQPLVATSKHPDAFSVFLRIAELLQHYEFSNFDGSTVGEEAMSSFKIHLEEFRLADVRHSREKTIEAIVLGERMKNPELYNEGFVHAAGKYDDIVQLQSPKFHLISGTTRKRLERATIDLGSRLKTVRTRLEDFEFPSLFSGIAQSTSSTESKVVRFKAWKASFMSMRKHVLFFYSQRYGAWPPKAKSKKNSFEESGLNRCLLHELYQDFSTLYDILVDRTALTTRTTELSTTSGSTDADSAPALRRVLGEFDHSSPPFQPAIPFDTPQLPSLATTRRYYNSLDARKQAKERAKKLQDDEINQALMQSYNRDSIKATDFLESYMTFERRIAHNKTIDEISDLRIGQWIFMYAVLQSLPLVVIDAPDLKWTHGVEYFLCEVPKGTLPWCQEDSSRKMGWYEIAGGAGVVSLPAELVEHGVEGIYHRSHCWVVAKQWVDSDDESIPESDILLEDLPPPGLPLSTGLPESRSSSPSRRFPRESIHLGLEALPLPAGVAPMGAKKTMNYDPTKSFEDILGQTGMQNHDKKK